MGVADLTEFGGSEKELQPAAVKTIKKLRNYNVNESENVLVHASKVCGRVD